MATAWQLQDAKNRFSKVVNDALQTGPQTVTRHGEPVVVVVSIQTWRQMTQAQPRLKDYLRAGGLDDLELDRETSERDPVELP